jgi:hypothetical protein
MQLNREVFCSIAWMDLKLSKRSMGWGSWRQKKWQWRTGDELHFCKNYILFYTVLVKKKKQIQINMHLFALKNLGSLFGNIKNPSPKYIKMIRYPLLKCRARPGTFPLCILMPDHRGKLILDYRGDSPRVGFQIASASCRVCTEALLFFFFFFYYVPCMHIWIIRGFTLDRTLIYRLGISYPKCLGTEVFGGWVFFFSHFGILKDT